MPAPLLVNVPAVEVRAGDRVMGQGRGVVRRTRQQDGRTWLELESGLTLLVQPASEVCVRRAQAEG